MCLIFFHVIYEYPKKIVFARYDIYLNGDKLSHKIVVDKILKVLKMTYILICLLV